MHDDTGHLISLWNAEQAVDALLEERSGLDAAIDRAQTVLLSARTEVSKIETEQSKLQELERAHSRKLHSYTKRRDDTRQLIDTGAASDFLVAENQYKKCAAIADEVETVLLNNLEQQDEATSRHADASNVQDLKQHNLNKVQSAKTTRLPFLEKELETATAVRDAARKPVPRHHINRYDRLRQKGLSCVTSINGTVCSACRIAVNRTNLAEHKRGAVAHHCSNCGRFLGEIV